MAQINVTGAPFDQGVGVTTAPLVVLFERDDAIAVPLLSQLRLAGYDVRSSRTPVELFDILSKHLVSLVLVDLGTATAGRREFWVALDAHRRGRAMQVMTFRYVQPTGIFDLDFESTPRALADIEVQGAQDFQRLIDYVRQRIPLHGAPTPSAASWPHAQAPAAQQSGGIPPIGAMLGMASPFASNPFSTPQHIPQPSTPYGAQPMIQSGAMPPVPVQPISTPYPSPQPSPAAQSSGWDPAQQQPAGQAYATPASLEANSPFANPVTDNPFTREYEESPFAQPLRANPFVSEVSASLPPETVQPPQQPDWRTPPSLPSTRDWQAGVPAMQPIPVGSPAAAAFEYPFMSDTMRAGMPSPGSRGWDHSLPREHVASPWSEPFDTTPAQPAPQPPARPFMDAWTPPEDDMESADTGIMPSVAFVPRLTRMDSPTDEESHPSHHERLPVDGGELTQATEPVPASFVDMTSRLPVATSQSATDRALGSVLIEGALLTEQRLEVLRGVQSMLSGVDMHFKIGELALLFKFLSPDQLLAALLVSRGLVSPQQIAGLGRVKQELAASGMDYDLEGLLEMFHILPREQLRALRSELA